MTLRTVECAGGCGWGTVVAVDHRYREPVRPEDVPGDREGAARCRIRELLLEDADARDLTKLAEYEAVGGYESLRKALGMERQAVLDELLAANVRGRGGAGFPMGRKASFLPKPDDTPKPIYLVVNADESEPGTFKDREIMLRVPHLFIEGVVIAAYTIGANLAFIYVRGEYLTEFEVLEAALEEAREAGYVGKDVLGSGLDLTVVVHRGAGAYICGEETGPARVARGQARAAADEAAVPGHLRPLRLADADQQRRDARHRAQDPRDGRQGVRPARRRELRRHARLLALRQRRAAEATTSSSSGRRSASSSTTSAAGSRTGAS